MATAPSPTVSSLLQCVIVTPEATVLETAAEFVALPLYDGEAGIGLHHSPMIGRLGYGELRIRNGDEVRRFYVDGGFVQVADNVVSILTGRALPAEKIDVAAAEELLREASNLKAKGEEELDIRARRLSQARGQLRVARRDH